MVFATFIAVGNIPSDKDLLKIMLRGIDIEFINFSNLCGENSSYPELCLSFSDDMILRISIGSVGDRYNIGDCIEKVWWVYQK